MYIRLTRMFKRLTPEAKEKAQAFVDKTVSTSKEDPIEDGLPLSWYEEQGLKAPSELYEREETTHGIAFSTETDMVDAESDFLCNTDLVEDFERFEGKTIVVYNSGKEIIVKEDLEEILRKTRDNG